VPAGHGVQLDWPIVSTKEPGAHGVQVTLLGAVETLPIGHGVQMFPLTKVPGSQFGWQSLALSLPTGEVCPFEHEVQVIVPRVSA
jgi:hypothetical protein